MNIKLNNSNVITMISFIEKDNNINNINNNNNAIINYQFKLVYVYIDVKSIKCLLMYFSIFIITFNFLLRKYKYLIINNKYIFIIYCVHILSFLQK